jgi:hypothetical protein
MNWRRLVFGLAVLLFVVGALFVGFAPGGIFDRTNIIQIETPFGSLIRRNRDISAWTVVGYVLMGTGGLALVVALAIKPRGQ